MTGLIRRQALAALAAAALLSAPAMAQETVKVGLLLTYSGPSGLAGQHADDTIKVFQQRYGSTAGDKKIEFVKRDTTGPNPEVAKRLVQELIVREKVQLMIGPDFTPNVLASAPLITEGKVPTIIAGAATTGIIGEKSPYLMRTFFAIPQLVAPLAQYAYKTGARKLFVLVADYAPGHDAENLITKPATCASRCAAPSSPATCSASRTRRRTPCSGFCRWAN